MSEAARERVAREKGGLGSGGTGSFAVRDGSQRAIIGFKQDDTYFVGLMAEERGTVQ